jgi:hypothetical protein
MDFVNVLGGNEIYNFRIHRLVHFCSGIWSFWCSNRGSANKFVSVALSAVTSRRDAAPSAFAPVRRLRQPSPEAGRRPRPCSSRGRPCPAMRRSPCPRHMPVRHARRASRTRPPSVRRPVHDPHPRASYYGRDITPSSPLVGLPPI